MSKHVLILLGAVLLSGCAADAGPPPGSGLLVVDWTVSGTKDPAECDASGASEIDVTVSNGGVVIGEFRSDCRDFSQSIALAPGSYEVDALLLDAAGRDRTTTLPLGPVNVFGGDQVIVPINFPASSFL